MSHSNGIDLIFSEIGTAKKLLKARLLYHNSASI